MDSTVQYMYILYPALDTLYSAVLHMNTQHCTVQYQCPARALNDSLWTMETDEGVTAAGLALMSSEKVYSWLLKNGLTYLGSLSGGIHWYRAVLYCKQLLYSTVVYSSMLYSSTVQYRTSFYSRNCTALQYRYGTVPEASLNNFLAPS